MKPSIKKVLDKYAHWIADIDPNEGHYIVMLRDGFKCAATDTHFIDGSTAKELRDDFESIEQCYCDECRRKTK